MTPDRRPRVYIAGPYRSDPLLGTANAIEAGDDLARLGVIPFVPHLTIVWDAWRPNPERFYLDFDLDWLEACDALYRLPGASAGADAEVCRMLELDRPVFFRVGELVRWADAWRAGREEEAELIAVASMLAHAFEESEPKPEPEIKRVLMGYAWGIPIYAYRSVEGVA